MASTLLRQSFGLVTDVVRNSAGDSQVMKGKHGNQGISVSACSMVFFPYSLITRGNERHLTVLIQLRLARNKAEVL